MFGRQLAICQAQVGQGVPGATWKTIIGFCQAYKESIRKGSAE
jgi:hypothetical protein